jgi:hypothetical protein
MTRALHTLSATAFARTISSAKTPARAFMIGDRPTGAYRGTDANANALATRCALQ